MATPYPDRPKYDRPNGDTDGTPSEVADAQLDLAIATAEDGLAALKEGEIQQGAYTLLQAAASAMLGETVADIRDGYLTLSNEEEEV